MTAKVGDVFFCASYGNVIKVTGATITDSGQPQTGYYYCVATATSTSVTFSLVSGQTTRFQIGQFR